MKQIKNARGRKKERRVVYKAEEKRAYLFLTMPAVIAYWAVVAFPVVFAVGMSLSDYSGGSIWGGTVSFVGFRHYLRMFNDEFFWISLKNNIYIVLISVFGQIPLGFIFAYALYRKLVVARDFFQTMIYMPVVISPIVIGILWAFIMSPYGLITEIMQRISPGWENTILINPTNAVLAVLFVILWMYTGTYLLIFLANLQKIDPYLLEAAKIDGANEKQILGRIILPSLSGVIVTTIILAIFGSLQSFTLIFAMTRGAPARRTSVLALYMYDTAFRPPIDYPMANAVSIVLVIMSLILIVLTKAVEKRFGGREE